MDKQKKTTVHSLSLPYLEPQWPSISAENEQAILQFLLPLLQPIGDFRRNHVPRSKGKGRARKPNRETEEDSLPTWMPEVYDHLTIGFNSTVRRLESLARSHKPQILSRDTDANQPDNIGANFSVVFVCRKNLPDIMTSSLPLLIATSAPKATQAKLVELSAQGEEKIAQALHQPRVGVLGIEEGAANTDALLRLVHVEVASVNIPWLNQGPTPAYHPVKIQTIVSTSKSKPATQSHKRKRPEVG